MLMSDLFESTAIFSLYTKDGKLVRDGLTRTQILSLANNPETAKTLSRLDIRLNSKMGILSTHQALPAYSNSTENEPNIVNDPMFKQQALSNYPKRLRTV